MKIYKLYFDYNSIKLDIEGFITNINDCVYISEYEWDEDEEKVGNFIRRMNGWYGHYSEEYKMDIPVEEMEEMECLDDSFENVQDAVDALDSYLDNYKDWRTIYGGRWNPDEYECTGLGDRDEIYYRIRNSWKERRLT